MIIFKAAAFLVVSLFLGVRLSPRLFQLASRLHARGVLLALGLALCFLMSWLANLVGLAPLSAPLPPDSFWKDVHYRNFVDVGSTRWKISSSPFRDSCPIFFVLMGVRTDLRTFAAPGVLGLCGGADSGGGAWQASLLTRRLGRGVDRLTVGLGMIPARRGRPYLRQHCVGLTVGGQPIIDRGTFSAIVVMVIVHNAGHADRAEIRHAARGSTTEF